MTHTSPDNTFLKQCDASKVLKRKQFFFQAECPQSSPRKKSIDNPWIVFESSFQARAGIKHDTCSSLEEQMLG